MLELRHSSPLDLHLGFAGDTYNTAVYLRRMADNLGANAEVGYLTGLGDDVYSARMRRAWAEEGIRDHSVTVPGRQPGVYAVNTDREGERSFTYWRAASAASALFVGDGWVSQVTADLIHFSGITLQLMSRLARTAFLARLADLRGAGTLVSFDTNYRPSGWSDIALARDAFAQAASQTDIILATFDDEAAVAKDTNPVETVARYRRLGAREVLVKLGAEGVIVAEGLSRCDHVPATLVPKVVDTTAAGDSFAGGYLAGRLAGMNAVEAAGLGAELAAVVIQSPGAIISTDEVAQAVRARQITRS